MIQNTKQKILRSIGALFALTLAPAAFAAPELRDCVATGMSARCGDAKELVLCEGYRQAHFIADDQKLASLVVDLYVGPPDLHRRIVHDLARIDAPRASIREFTLALNGNGQALLRGEISATEGTDSAVTELAAAFRARKSRIAADPRVDAPTLGRFKIPSSAALYESCDTRSAIVAPGSDEPRESEDDRRIREKREHDLRIEAQLRAKYGLAPGTQVGGFIEGMDYFLSKFTGSVKVRQEGAALAIEHSSGTGFYYGALIPVIMKHWNLTEAQTREGIALEIVNGARTR